MMGWRPKGPTPTDLPRKSSGGMNRECANCVYPCTGGEVLHKRGHCCRSFCPCEMFEPKRAKSILSELNAGVKGKSKATGAKW